MAMRLPGTTIREIHTLFNWGSLGTLTDGQLVSLFAAGREGSEAAFRALIHRHGPMVLGVCRRVLGDDHAAEDAFQATFLVLVKKAGSLRDSEQLTSWLYGVALRVSRRARAKGIRHRGVELRAASEVAGVGRDLDHFELRAVIDEEIHRLPERYREPLILCHLEGLPHDEVAQRLGCPLGTVESRLSRARERLRGQLTRRGLAPTELPIGAVLKPLASQSTPLLATSLVESTFRAAVGPAARIRTQGTRASSLIERISIIGASHQITKLGTILVVAVGLAAGLRAYRAQGERLADTRRPQPPPSTPAHPTDVAPASPALSDHTDQAGSSPIPSPGAKPSRPKLERPRPSRSPTAYAAALAGITIDGRLDDWPQELPKYPIRNRLISHPAYDSASKVDQTDPEAYFLAGFNVDNQFVYLAVVVRDRTLKLHRDARRRPGAGDFHPAFDSDAVEVYIDGTASNRAIEEPPKGWDGLDASTMPVLQFVAVPGDIPAYGDPFGANPSLLYSKTQEPRTKMKYRRQGDITTYEWAIQPYDRFPELPTEIHAGKRLGLEVAVVDKDAVKPAVFMTWGQPPTMFKGLNAGSLGELILSDSP
jgi:RNA polymerase sigma factor (sigma-70 family)